MLKFKILVKNVGKTSFGNDIMAVIAEPYMRITKDGRDRVLEVLRATGWSGRYWSMMIEGKSRLVYSKVNAEELKAIFEELPKESWTKPEAKPTKVKATKVREVVAKEKDAEFEAIKNSVKELTAIVKALASR